MFKVNENSHEAPRHRGELAPNHHYHAASKIGNITQAPAGHLAPLSGSTEAPPSAISLKAA